VGLILTTVLGRMGVLCSSPKMGCVDPMYVLVIGLSGNRGISSSMTFPRGSKRSNNGSRGITEAGPVVVTEVSSREIVVF
jgi:hypothetical protein